MAEGRDRGGSVLQQTALEVGIGPGLGDDARAVVRADLGLIGLDDEVERLGVDVTLLGQDGLERPHPQLHLAELGAVVVVIVIVVARVAHAAKFSRRWMLCLPAAPWWRAPPPCNIAGQKMRASGEPGWETAMKSSS